MSELIGQRYELQEELGRGAFAVVRKAVDLRLKTTVAVKLLDSHQWHSEQDFSAGQFMKEAQVMAQLDHPHIVKVTDVGREGSQLYLVMEYLPGGHLGSKLATKPKWSAAEVVDLLRPIAEALDYAHQRQMIHRDVKPQNILFTADGRPKLADFGLVKILNQTIKGSYSLRSNGRVLGTPGYLPPDEEITPATDVYSLAVVLFQMLTGELPHRVSGVNTIIQPLEKVKPKLAHLPAEVQKGVLQGLAIEPEERPGGTKELMQGIRPRGGTKVEKKPGFTAQLLSWLRPEVKKTPPAKIVVPAQPRLKSELAPGVWLEWVEVPAGPFWMGAHPADDHQIDNERPYHQVILEGFRLGKYPVTNVQFEAFVKATGYKIQDRQDVHGVSWRTSFADKTKSDHPAINVSWFDAVAFCEWASEKTGEKIYLPTEAEWEKGARGADGRVYPWGMKWEDGRCNSWSTGPKITTTVTQYPGGVSSYGAWDMAGNVWEWTNSWYMAYPGSTHQDRDYGQKYRVLRGGSWNNKEVRSSNRNRVNSGYRSNNIGFRCGSTLV